MGIDAWQYALEHFAFTLGLPAPNCAAVARAALEEEGVPQTSGEARALLLTFYQHLTLNHADVAFTKAGDDMWQMLIEEYRDNC